MTKITPRTLTLTLPAADVVGADGLPVSIGMGHIELRLKTEPMRGLRLLLRGMEHTSEETRKHARHKHMVVEWLLCQVAAAYDAAAVPEANQLSEQSKKSTKSENRKP